MIPTDKQAVAAYFRGDYLKFYRQYLPEIRPAANGQSIALCPFHEDREPSLSLRNDNGLFKCFGCGAAGSIFDFYAKKNDLDARRDLNRIITEIAQQFEITNGNGHHEARQQKTTPRVVARYDYTDQAGRLVYQIERMDPKSFRIRRPDGQGWAYDSKGVKIVPYHLPEVLGADEILIVEGEKDAENLGLMGFTATTNPFGAGKWPDNFGPYFAGKHVVLIPDNDDPGRVHMHKVATYLKGHAASIRLLELPALPEKGDVSDFISKFASKEEAAERLAILIEGAASIQIQAEETSQHKIRILTASEWMLTPLLPAEQIITDLFDVKDKFAVIGGSKTRKTFFTLQMIMALATGRPFLKWHVPKARTVVHVQYEITERHFLERLIRMARAEGIDRAELTNLHIINARGLNLTGKRGIDQISKSLSSYKPEVILFDPLYKISEGVENAAEDMKIILSQFDHLAEKTSAAVGYVHHDPKGQAGDRSTRDRGAGSNVLSRDYDAAFVLTEHASEEDAVVLEMLLRNYRPQEPFVIEWAEDDESGGYCFQAREDIAPEKKTANSKRAAQPALLSYLSIAQIILENNEMEIGVFKSIFKQRSGLSDNRIKDFLTWAQSGGKPHLTTREERARKTHKKWIRISGDMFNE